MPRTRVCVHPREKSAMICVETPQSKLIQDQNNREVLDFPNTAAAANATFSRKAIKP